MTPRSRWDPCIYHRGSHATDFLREYLSASERQVLLIAGAGFDPRSTQVCETMAAAAPGRIRGLLLREERPTPPPELVRRAERNCEQLRARLSAAQVHSIEVFAADNAVVGGRNAVAVVNEVPLEGTTDLFVDVSALSIGVAFPLIRHLLRCVETSSAGGVCNLHVVVIDEPSTDGAIRSVSCDRPSPTHGLRGKWGLTRWPAPATLWMPQLSRAKQTVLGQIFQVLRNEQPDPVVCPILPFPSSDPRLADELLEEYEEELRPDNWNVDARDLVFADEQSPVDLYRTILRIDQARSRVFAEVGGSQIVLSPLGSKTLSLGALMAALERDFTVMYVESIGYDVDFARMEAARPHQPSDIVHVWLHGDAYASVAGTEGPGE
jgi:hypothetical protein